jgi:hypothetical protein
MSGSKAVDGRIEAARQLLEWLERALEPEPRVSPAAQMPRPTTPPADLGQSAPTAHPLKDFPLVITHH